MTPKEKAQQLVDTFNQRLDIDQDLCNKGCALECVSQILDVLSDYEDTSTKLFWNEVSIEIEKIETSM